MQVCCPAFAVSLTTLAAQNGGTVSEALRQLLLAQAQARNGVRSIGVFRKPRDLTRVWNIS